jgi:subtilisin family serine protease
MHRTTYAPENYLKIWVFFNCKNNPVSTSALSKRAVARRTAAKFTQDENDIPVDSAFVNKIIALGGKFENVYRWGNAASFRVTMDLLPEIENLPYVKNIAPVPVYRIKKIPSGVLNKSSGYTEAVFKARNAQLDVLKILQAHTWLTRKKTATQPGEGVFIGFFDSGFRLDHVCFNHLKKSAKIKAMHDFVDGDNDPQDSDSSLNHGATVLAQVSGYDPGTFTGVAWGADIALARTEISEQEIHAEEDNWVAALVWAESLGVDIVSSSLGYATDFEDSVLIGNKYVTNYPFSSLDGHSTIISHAADLAAERGMIIVNAVGNEGSSISGTLNAPADVEGVISVGSINANGFISAFSSTGPAADGRIKPDCVAPGEDIVVPGFKPADTYLKTFSGSSYSTPLVSGVAALIIQSIGKKYTADNVIKKLYGSCVFAKGQSEIDNRYGRGIPDALAAVMDSNELFIETTDSSGIPIARVTLCSADNRLIGVSDSSGVIFARIGVETATLRLISLWDTVSFSVEKLPYYKHVILANITGVTVKIVDSSNEPVSECNVTVEVVSDTSVWHLKSNESGELRFIYSKQGEIEISVSANGYYTPGTVTANLTGVGDSVLIRLTKIPENSFIVFPTIVKKDDRVVTLVFSSGSQSNTSNATASIYSVSGNLVWSERMQSQHLEPFIFKWQCRDAQKNIVPGMYYAILKHGKKTYKCKMLIVG